MSRTSQLTIQRGEVIPDITLPDRNGHEVSTRDAYLRRNLVLAELPKTPNPGWETWVRRFGQVSGEIPHGDASVLLVVPVEMDAGLRAEVEALPETVRVLADEQDLTGRRLGTASDEGLLVVTDRYGVAFVIQTGGPDDDEMDPAEIPGWVEFIACQCS